MRHAQLLRLHQQRRSRGIVDHVQHQRKPRKATQIHGGSAVIRIHSHGRGVDDHLRVRMAVEIAVMVLSHAGDYPHLPRPLIAQHGAHRRSGAAAAEHERLLSTHRNTAAAQHMPKAEHVRIVAVKRTVRAPDDRIHAADCLRRVRKRRAVRNHGLFIGNRNVQAVKIAALQKLRQLLPRAGKPLVGVFPQTRVNRR